jgi:hypothetical protein
MVRAPEGERGYSLLQSVQAESLAHPVLIQWQPRFLHGQWSARGVILIIRLQPVARLSLTRTVLPHRTWFHGTRRIYFTSSKLINITKVTLHGDKLYRDNRFSHFNKQVGIKLDQQITKTAVREVNHASFHLSSTFLCKITQAIQMSTDQKKKKYWRIQSLRRQFFKLSVWKPL